MTIRLLTARNGFDANTLMDLDAATEAALILARAATSDLTGGVRRYREQSLAGVAQDFTVAALDRITFTIDQGQALSLALSVGTDAFIEVLDDSGVPSQPVPLLAKVGIPTTIGPFAAARRVRITNKIGSVVASVKRPAVTRRLDNTAVLVGDSNTQQTFDISYIASASRTNGIVTVVTSSQPFYVFPGSPIQIVGLPEDMCGLQTIATTNDGAKTYTYAAPGLDVPVASVQPFAALVNLAKPMDNGWFNWANILSGQRFDLVGMAAGTGRVTDEMLARISEAAGLDASMAFVMGGTNDVNGNRSAASIIANLQAIYEALLASDKKVYALTILPLGSGNSQWTAAKTAVILQVNGWIKSYCRATNGMQCIDVFGATVDPMAANKGQAATGMLRSDGLHLTQLGAYTIGKLVRDETASHQRNDFRTTSNADNRGTEIAP